MLPCPLHQRGLTLTEHTWPPGCANATRDVRTAVQTDVRRTVPTDPTGFHNLMWATLPVCGVWLGWGLCWPALSRDTELAERDRDVGIRRTDLLQEGLTWLWTPGSPTDHICRRRSQPESDGLGAMGGGGGQDKVDAAPSSVFQSYTGPQQVGGQGGFLRTDHRFRHWFLTDTAQQAQKHGLTSKPGPRQGDP